MLGVWIQLPQHLLPQWLLCVKSLAVALHCFFLEQVSKGIFSAVELTREDRRDLEELSSG